MRFKHQRAQASLPEINLIPMLNVMMGILAFFVMITMMLTAQEGLEVPLPADPSRATDAPTDLPEPLVVRLTQQGIEVDGRAIALPQLQQQIQIYVTNAPTGIVALQPEPDMPYDQVLQLLGAMKDVGGAQVALAID